MNIGTLFSCLCITWASTVHVSTVFISYLVASEYVSASTSSCPCNHYSCLCITDNCLCNPYNSPFHPCLIFSAFLQIPLQTLASAIITVALQIPLQQVCWQSYVVCCISCIPTIVASAISSVVLPFLHNSLHSLQLSLHSPQLPLLYLQLLYLTCSILCIPYSCLCIYYSCLCHIYSYSTYSSLFFAFPTAAFAFTTVASAISTVALPILHNSLHSLQLPLH